MRQIGPYPLWLGHVGDVRALPNVLDAGITALVDLAINEPPATITRELVYCRFPLVDGAGNPSRLLRAAIETTASLLRTHTPTLVFCASGMSRSPAIAAAALSLLTPASAADCLATVTQGGPRGVSPALWQDVARVLLDLRHAARG
jgi:protein-tyrosine phosphatase